MAEPITTLADLRGLRTAPPLSPIQREALRAELARAMAPCDWFTIGVMAASAPAALNALRRWESAFGWDPLKAAVPSEEIEGSVFLKGHQRNGSFWLRHEAGLGEGVLITGQHPEKPDLTDTWGPFPLDLV